MNPPEAINLTKIIQHAKPKIKPTNHEERMKNSAVYLQMQSLENQELEMMMKPLQQQKTATCS